MKQIFIILSFFITTISSQTYDKSYLIFVGSNYSDYQNLTVYSNFSSIYGTKYFNDSKSSVLIIHGYRDGYNDEFSKSMVNAFLNKTGYNVIIGDWSAYAMSLDYPLVVSQVNGVSGSEYGIFIRFLDILMIRFLDILINLCDKIKIMNFLSRYFY